MNQNRVRKMRLKYEKNFLERYFYGEKFHMRSKNRETIFERKVTTSNGQNYGLRIYVGPYYPYVLPQLVVVDSPKPMPTSPEWQGSHITHTWQSRDGLLQICFFRPLSWTKENRLYEVFNKGQEWLEAYEEHRVTGKQMNEILIEMEPTEEELAEQKRRAKKQVLQFEQFMREAFLPFVLASGLILQEALNDSASSIHHKLGQIESPESTEKTEEPCEDKALAPLEQVVWGMFLQFALANGL